MIRSRCKLSEEIKNLDKKSFALVKIDQIKLRLLIITKNKKMFEAVASHLQKRGWEAELEDSIKNSFQRIADYKPDFILFSVNMPTRKREQLPMLYYHTFSIPVVLFGENGDILTTKWLQEIETNYKMQGQLTGPSAHRRLKNILHYIKTEDGAVGREIIEKHIAEVEKQTKAEEALNKEERQQRASSRGKQKKTYSFQTEDHHSENKKKVPAYLKKLEQEEAEFRKLKNQDIESKRLQDSSDEVTGIDPNPGQISSELNQDDEDKNVFSQNEIESIKRARSAWKNKIEEGTSEIDKYMAIAKDGEEDIDDAIQSEIKGTWSKGALNLQVGEESLKAGKLAEEVTQDEEEFTLDDINRAAVEFKDQQKKLSIAENIESEKLESPQIDLLNQSAEELKVSDREEFTGEDVEAAKSKFEDESSDQNYEKFKSQADSLFGRVAKASMESIVDHGSVSLADVSKRQMEKISCVIPIIAEGKEAYIVVSHEIEKGAAAKFDEKFISVLREEVKKISPNFEIQEKAYETIEVLSQDDQLIGEVFTKEIESENGKITLKYVDSDDWSLHAEYIEKDKRYKIKAQDLVAEKSQGADVFIFLPKNGRYFLYLKKGSWISKKQIDKLSEAGVSVYVKEVDFEIFKKTHQLNMAEPLFHSAKKKRKVS